MPFSGHWQFLACLRRICKGWKQQGSVTSHILLSLLCICWAGRIHGALPLVCFSQSDRPSGNSPVDYLQPLLQAKTGTKAMRYRVTWWDLEEKPDEVVVVMQIVWISLKAGPSMAPQQPAVPRSVSGGVMGCLPFWPYMPRGYLTQPTSER